VKVFLDTEFTDFVRPRLISIGMAARSGQHFYAEVPYSDKECSEFVRKTVIPLLGIGFRTLTGGNEALYLNLVLVRALPDGIKQDELHLREYFVRHIYRGLSYVFGLKGGTPQFIAVNLLAPSWSEVANSGD
jgi:hypothetical protein